MAQDGIINWYLVGYLFVWTSMGFSGSGGGGTATGVGGGIYYYYTWCGIIIGGGT